MLCHLYVIRMYSLVTLISSHAIRISLVRHPYSTRIYSYAIGMSHVCHPYVTRMESYVTYVTRLRFYNKPIHNVSLLRSSRYKYYLIWNPDANLWRSINKFYQKKEETKNGVYNQKQFIEKFRTGSLTHEMGIMLE